MVIADPGPVRPSVCVLSRRGASSLAPQHREQLMAAADLRAHASQHPPAPDDARALLADADVLAATNACLPVLDDELLCRLPRLRALVLFATGYDSVDLDALRRHDVTLVAVPDYATISVAEHGCWAPIPTGAHGSEPPLSASTPPS